MGLIAAVSHYELLDKLGEGGMGVVYKARDVRLDRFVALKRIAPHLLDSPQARRRFVDEARTLSSLNHPHIETLYDVVDDAGSPVLVLEYLPGGALRARAGGRKLAPAELVAYALQIADGLEYAHRRGVIHRDLKPENMLFTEDGNLKISDFGLARLRCAADVTRTDAIMGTPAYLSPECVQGMQSDTRADIFSFGVMLYEMAAGEPPFTGAHAAAVLYDIVHKPAPCLRRLRPDLPEALQRVVERALEKDRERRYQSMEELAGGLRGEPTPELQPDAAQTILVAEDADDLRDAVRIGLATEGYRVLTVRNGREAVRVALEQGPDLVLLDVMMPGLNGLDACRELRQRGFPGPIVMLTGKAEEIDRVLGLEMGADDYVTKPFSARELLSRVRAHLRRERRAARDAGRASQVTV